MKKRSMMAMAGLVACGSAFGALVNDAQFVDQDWSVDMAIPMDKTAGGTGTSGLYKARGGDGLWPVVSGGELSLTMVGATNGLTQVSSGSLNTYTFSEAADYIVTTRMRVDQFADVASDTSFNGINFFDIRGRDRTYIHLNADSVWVANASGILTKAADITTTVGTYYTWQFEVSQIEGSGAGSVDIFRRDSDLDTWTTVATGVSIRDQDVGVDQFLLYPIRYNYDNTQAQGAVTSDYLQIGTAIPEPASLGLIGLAGLLIVGARRLAI